MKRYLLATLALLLTFQSAAETPPLLTDDQLEDRVKAKGYGFQLIKEGADLFRREADRKYQLILSERGSKADKNLSDCEERERQKGHQDFLSEIAACAGDTGGIPVNMRNRLQGEMLEGGIYYVREVRRPLLGLLSSNVYSNFSEKIYSIDQIVEEWQGTEIIVTHDQPTSIAPGRVVLNPGDQKGRIFILNYKIMLASALLMFDTYEEILSKYLFDEEMRKSIRYMDARYRDVNETLIGLWERVESGEVLEHLSQAVDHYEVITKALKETKVSAALSGESAKLERNLDKAIKSSIAYRYAKESPDKLANRKGISLFWHQKTDSFLSWWRTRAHNVSQFFGNLVGQGQCRKGVMYEAYHGKVASLAALASEMKAGDILFEKTPFRATDKYIPGHYGHVAIWTGTREELEAYGVWDQLPQLHREAVNFYNYPESPTFQESVLAGARIVEALRPGVKFHTLEHFMDIDDLGAIRPVVCGSNDKANDPNSSGCNTPDEIRRALVNSFQQLGKTYDFAFDTFTKDKIVCSELAYQAYDHVDFDISPSLGTMASISPDQVAFKADGLGENNSSRDPFVPAVIIHNGTRIQGDQDFLTQVFNKLLEATDESYQWVYSNTDAKPLERCF